MRGGVWQNRYETLTDIEDVAGLRDLRQRKTPPTPTAQSCMYATRSHGRPRHIVPKPRAIMPPIVEAVVAAGGVYTATVADMGADLTRSQGK